MPISTMPNTFFPGGEILQGCFDHLRPHLLRASATGLSFQTAFEDKLNDLHC